MAILIRRGLSELLMFNLDIAASRAVVCDVVYVALVRIFLELVRVINVHRNSLTGQRYTCTYVQPRS